MAKAKFKKGVKVYQPEVVPKAEQPKRNIFVRMFQGIVQFIDDALDLVFLDKSKNENVFQWIIRNLLISDSKGKPSWSTTILVYVMAIIGFITYVECSNALSVETVTEIKADGLKAVSTKIKGFSESFLYLVIALSAIVTTYANSRYKRASQSKMVDEGEEIDPSVQSGAPASGPVGKIIEKVKNVIGG